MKEFLRVLGLVLLYGNLLAVAVTFFGIFLFAHNMIGCIDINGQGEAVIEAILIPAELILGLFAIKWSWHKKS